MIALRIEEQKKFTSGLFIGELFDQFLLREADIVTFNRFTIDGRRVYVPARLPDPGQ